MRKAWMLMLLALATMIAAAQTVHITENTAQFITISNDIAAFSFQKNEGLMTGIQYGKYSNILGKKGSAYLSGPGFSMRPSSFRIVRQDKDRIEIAFYHKASNHFSYDLHYIVRQGVSGVYCYLIQSHKGTDTAGNYGQTRWGIRGDESLFDYHLVRDSIQGPMPKMADLLAGKKIQDWTYQLPNGEIYTKYNYADYIEGRFVHGMAGRQSGLGMFVIQASHEYLNGGPTKQYQNVHSSPFLICMFNCGHFLSDIRKGDNIVTGNWTKLNGPFLLYLNHGSSIQDLWQDAKKQSVIEKKQWPYTWVNNAALYPMERGVVKGTIHNQNNQPVQNAMIILADSAHDWQAQSLGYIFAQRTDQLGQFNLQSVRPGTYTLYAFGGNNMKAFRKDHIEVTAGQSLNLNTLRWPAENISQPPVWQIGIADRTTHGFKYSTHKRVYGLFDSVPANLDLTIARTAGSGNSDNALTGSANAADWYYAQTQIGSFNIHFTTEKASHSRDSAILWIAIAGAAKNPVLKILVNGTEAGTLNHLGNDASIYRSAIAGGYYQLKQIVFPASLLKQGNNTLSLNMVRCKNGGGIMYDAIKLTWQ